ncbi:MAG: DUF3035 domain-containing protein [Pseudomonadota bacterium]
MRLGFGILALLALGACSGGGGLVDLRTASNGPDEFSALPVSPLEQPANFTDLPTPTPGLSNRADRNPQAEAIAALGGSLSSGGGIPGSDAALVAHTGRYGTDPAIRSELFAADEAFRKRRGRIGFLGLRRDTRYWNAYAGQALDAGAETDRFRAAGVRVPSAPPQ